jgi:medium-chain acyl-[acyl-carrier-protein] hydrolase
VRVFCFPFAGGTASSFFDWRKRSNGLEIDPIEYPGRGGRWKEKACATLEGLVQAIADDLRSRLGEPYAFLGHSFGALVAFELARLLNRLNTSMPVRLLVSGARAPHLPLRENIHELPEPEFLARLTSFDGIPQEAMDNTELMSLLLPIVRHDFRLYEEYRYIQEARLPVAISSFGGLQDPKVPAGDLLAWSQHTSKSFRSRFYPGKHFFLFEQQDHLLRDIHADLEASTAATLSASVR